jgi:hypothetical protein
MTVNQEPGPAARAARLAEAARRARERSAELGRDAEAMARDVARTEADIARTMRQLAEQLPEHATRLLALSAAAAAYNKSELEWASRHSRGASADAAPRPEPAEPSQCASAPVPGSSESS